MIEPSLLPLLEANPIPYFENSYWNVQRFLRTWELEAKRDINEAEGCKQDKIIIDYLNNCQNILIRVKNLQEMQKDFEKDMI